ncbi:putative asparagine--tRNA ligase-like isoform X2 [Leptotrombidium deliense]|uniref:Putative asparagine--tRNA ligase-like isoform X2 n=1 Tax=Leptotrombidium deliense TaxID=299467 RepID=A0A443SMJ9_9ACAR|nr:putative asparagine--tRNA ligase-like isoform X2 [Leptotrombidium deliense]
MSTVNEKLLEINSNVRTVRVCDALRKDPIEDERVAVKGWVQRVANHKNILFVHLCDGFSSDQLQIVIPQEILYKTTVNYGSSIYCEGVIKKSTGKQQAVELLCDRILIIGDCTDFPISYMKFDWGDLRQSQHLRMRVPKYATLMRLRKNSQSLRHVSEFTMLEVEEAFVDSIDNLMDNVERLFKSMLNHILENQKTVNALTKEKSLLNKMLNMKFIRLTYEEALDILNKTENNHIKYGEDISAAHERALLDYFEFIPVFITHYPFEIKPFYMKREGNKALCFDLISKTGGEICGGSVREDNYDLLKQRIDTMKNPSAFDWYLDLRKFGTVPHSGFGFGFDRYVQSITGVTNIKDVIPFPRWPHHCKL